MKAFDHIAKLTDDMCRTAGLPLTDWERLEEEARAEARQKMTDEQLQEMYIDHRADQIDRAWDEYKETHA